MESKKSPLSYPVASVCLLILGDLNKLWDAEKGAWILISCRSGKVNEKGAGRKAERVLHHQAFMSPPPYSFQGQVASYSIGQDRPTAERQVMFVFLWSQSIL